MHPRHKLSGFSRKDKASAEPFIGLPGLVRHLTQMHKRIQRFAVAHIYHRIKPFIKSARLLLRGIFYLGTTYHCPCCGWSVRIFLPGGDQRRPNAQCPRCASLERHRLLWLFLKNRTNLFSAKLKVLHIAPEPVFQRIFQSSELNLEYLSADLHNPLAMMNIDITTIPFANATFDVILANHVLEHVVDDRKAMKELYRVLRNTGWAIIQSPIDEGRQSTFEDPAITSPNERARIFGQSDHVRIYGRDYSKRLEEAGFIVTVIDVAAEIGENEARRFGLLKEEKIFLCSCR
ncbi:MAG: methyltransferase domain-containing protein [bacterium]